MAYRGPTQDEVDADMDSEAAIRLAEAGGDIMQVSIFAPARAAVQMLSELCGDFDAFALCIR